jgi:hypothetical protein
VARLARLLVAGARTTASLNDGAAWLVRRDIGRVVSVRLLHGVRVVRMHGLVS